MSHLRRFAPLMLFATLLIGAPALAQDHGEKGQPKPPEEAAEPITFNDRNRVIEISLPRNWKAEKHDAERGQLAFWLGPLVKGANSGVIVERVRGARRAGFARASALAAGSGMVEGTMRAGDNWSEVARFDRDGRLARWFRFVEKDGEMLAIHLMVAKAALEKMHDEVFEFAQGTLDSVKFVGELEKPKPPKDWTTKKVKPYVLLTDCEGPELGKAERVVKDLADIPKLLGKALPGAPYVDVTPEVRIYQIPAKYEEDCTKALGEVPDAGGFDAGSGAILVKIGALNLGGFKEGVLQAAANERIVHHFGGSLPFWSQTGLRMYAMVGALAGGKPNKPDKKWISQSLQALSGSKPLNEYFGKSSTDFPDGLSTSRALWGWTWFFHHAKQASKHKKTYQAYLETMRDTGDPLEAEKVWESTDFEAMHADFQKWVESLK